MTNEILKTQNEGWGFWGTTSNYYSKKQTQKRWNEAFETLLELSSKKPEEIRTYLDSRSGRKLADCCNDTKNDVKSKILKVYFNWIEDDLFECNIKELKSINRMLFGTMVYDELKKQKVVVLYQGMKKGREDIYLKVIDRNENTYITRMDFLSPID